MNNYFGTPPNCHPECVLNSECSQLQSCIGNRCQDPCVGVCGTNAECKVHNHYPSCSCFAEYTGDPFTHCYPNIKRKMEYYFFKKKSFCIILIIDCSKRSY